MTMSISFPPEIEARLRARAAAAGQNVSAFVQQAVEEKLRAAAPEPRTPSDEVERRLRALQDWVASHPARVGVRMDDGRDAIYAGQSE